MTMDDGAFGNGIVEESFAARMDALALGKSMAVATAAERAGVSMDELRRAIEAGTYGFPGTMSILQRVLSEYGCDISYLYGATPVSKSEEESLRLRVFGVVMAFIDQMRGTEHELTKGDCRRLYAEVANKIKSLPRHSLRLAADAGIPLTILDVAQLWRRMNRK